MPAAVDGPGLLRWVVGCQRWPLLIGVVAGIVWMAVMALVPAALGLAIDRGVATGEVAAALPWVAVVVGLGVGRGAVGALRHWFAVRLYVDTRRMLVESIGDRVTDDRGGLDRERSPGEVVSHADSDAQQIAAAIDVLCRGSGAVVAVVIVTVALLQLSGTLGLVVLLGLPVLLALMVPLWRPLEARARHAQETVAAAAAMSGDAVVGLRVLQGFGGEPALRERFHGQVGHVRDAAVRVARLDAGWETMRVVVPGALLAVLVWLGGQQVLDGSLTPGGLVAAFGYATFLVTPLSTFGELGRKWARALAGASRIASLLRTPPGVTRPAAGEPPEGSGRVELQGLTLCVDGDAVIDGVDLAVRPGQHVGLVVDDPAAVEVLTEVLGAHRDPDGGTILLDGVDIRSLPPGLQRRHLLVAEHDAHLFGGTLRDNLDPAADDDRLLRALQDAGAIDVVDRLGLDGTVTARGRSLSGGQRQRIAVARALLADPPVLVLDDPTSAVDAHTERAVVEGLVDRRHGRTLLVVSHSPVMLAAMDEVVVLRGGRVVRRGSPRQVLAVPDVGSVLARAEWAVSR
ncbi:MAG: ABC transporter ATP-binding protein [Nitriliruptoraceae bacterium]